MTAQKAKAKHSQSLDYLRLVTNKQNTKNDKIKQKSQN